MRYAVDARKLRGLGWKQKVGLDKGLERTVEWYRKWGHGWWGDVRGCLSAFPEVNVEMELEGYAREAGRMKGTPLLEKARWEHRGGEGVRKVSGGREGGLLAPISLEMEVSGKVMGALAAVNSSATVNVGKNLRKRTREGDGKENEEMQGGGAKRALLEEGLGDDEVVR
jgi:hypothetical protein